MPQSVAAWMGDCLQMEIILQFFTATVYDLTCI